MESILEAINEWIKEILIGAINGNLSTMFGDVNEKVGTIAAEVGKTPQGWNANIFNMIQNLSENVIVPIAGLVITYVLCYELISMVTEKNNMHDVDTFMFFKWFFKAFVAVFLVTHTFDITMAVFDMAQHIVSGAAGVIGGDTNIDVTEALAAMQEGLKDMEIPELLLLVMETSLVSLCMKIMSVLITVILYGRMIEIYAYCSVSPIPFATMTNREWGQIGNNYLKGLFALGFQGFLIMICVGIYAGLVGEMVLADNLHSAIFSLAAYTVTGEKPTELQRAHIRQQKVAAQEQPAQEQPEQEAPQDKDTFSIYQIKGGDETRDLRFEPYERLTATGHRVDAKNYTLVYSAELTPGTSLEDIYTRFNIDHPKDFKGHSLSVSDVVVLHQNGQDTAHYVDSFGYKDVPEFLQPENYLKAAEQTTEQNYNMIDGQINNTPTATELEEKAKAGGQISLAEYAEALKAEKKQAEPEKKSSIRAQLKAAKEQAPKKQARQKTQDLERS